MVALSQFMFKYLYLFMFLFFFRGVLVLLSLSLLLLLVNTFFMCNNQCIFVFVQCALGCGGLLVGGLRWETVACEVLKRRNVKKRYCPHFMWMEKALKKWQRTVGGRASAQPGRKWNEKVQSGRPLIHHDKWERPRPRGIPDTTRWAVCTCLGFVCAKLEVNLNYL